MESNRDESVKCLKIGRDSLVKMDYDKALKFANKSQKLYPSQQAEDLIKLIEEKRNSTPTENSESEGVRQRRGSFSRTNGTTPIHKENESVEPAYTPEQLASVKRIKKCKTYYEILGVSKDATDADLKKSYRKMALQFHPDKNKAPGATEAFKSIGNAYAILSDSSKRKQYDLYGEEDVHRPSSNRNGHHRHSHSFEADISPEDLFNMFFSGSAFTYTSRQAERSRRHPHSAFHHRRDRERQGSEGMLSALFQLSPILIMVILSLFSIAMQGEDPYSFRKTGSYSTPRTTSKHGIPYFVKDSFSQAYSGRSLHKLEREIENIYINNLRNECYREQMQREQLRWKARYHSDSKAYEQASNMHLHSCNKLNELFGEG
ncbi:DNAJB12 [Bugula neritina]|uniref:DNAJB12 n=1 Tax=Bugula neritina TaxID=10212 RepID=A0A7J7JFH9_BUGNE|nr:DNAJB12 [Bugula neritina]